MPIKNTKHRLVPKTRWRKLIGLTGGFGTGKSTVLTMLRKKGAYTLDADQIVHRLLEKDNAVKNYISNAFGSAICSRKGFVNRQKLAAIIFESAGKRKILERLLHPRVRQDLKNGLLRKKGDVAVCDIPLLFENNWQSRFDETILVKASQNNQIARLQKKGFNRIDIKARIRSQMPMIRKKEKANFIINNNGTRRQTQKQVNFIWNQIIN